MIYRVLNACSDSRRQRAVLQRFARPLSSFLLSLGLLLGVHPGPASAQPEPRTFEDFDRILKRADHADAAYGAMLRPLEQARRLTGFMLRTESGAYASIGEEQARNLAAAIALNVMLNGTEGEPPPEVKRGSQIDMVVVRALRNVYGAFGQYAAYLKKAGAPAPNPGRVGDFVEHDLLSMLDALDQDNRAFLDKEIKEIERTRGMLAEMVADAQEQRRNALPSGAGNGFLNRAGYYVLRVSGSGWRKKYGGWATRIDGYQMFVVKVDDGTRQPKRESAHWTLPTGVDLRAMIRQWQEEVRQGSGRACTSPPPLCPCKEQPDIWEGAPEYTVIQGPFRKLDEARAAAGDPYIANGQPGSTKQWRHDTDRKIVEVERVCQSMGFGK